MDRVTLAVIGGGAAGVGAALAARAAGLDVALVRRAPGASALGGGGWIGPLPTHVGDALARAGLAHVPIRHPLPHPDGALRACDHAPAAQAAAVVETGACVVAIEGFPWFRATALARLWGAAAAAELVAARVSLPGTPAAGWATAALAASIEADPRPLGDALRRVAGSTGCTRLLLPAVLGERDVEGVRTALGQAAGVPVAEALGAAPSLPGWRLARAFDRALADGGVRVLDASVVDVHGEHDDALALEVLAPGATASFRLAADAVVLATGRFVGGGIGADPQFVETVFGAPVGVDHLGEQFDEADPLVLTDPVRTEPQPLLDAGVRVDARCRLIGGRDPVGGGRVLAAGVVRAGLAHGLGHAAADGARAVAAWLEGGPPCP